MCHLATKKALKGLYHRKLNKIPPKTHNLMYLLETTGITPSREIGEFLTDLMQTNVITRYPENLTKIKKMYTKSLTGKIIEQAKGTLQWIKMLLK